MTVTTTGPGGSPRPLRHLPYPIPAILSHYVRLLDTRTPFGLVNYADGEWRALQGQKRGKTCDGQRYGVAIEPLRRTIIEPHPYLHGITEHHIIERGLEYGRAQGWPIDDIPWVNKNIIYQANVRGEIAPFFQALRRRRVLIVGPAHLRRLELIKPVAFIEVPAREAMESIHATTLEVGAAIRRFRPEVVCVSAGPAAKVLIWRCWPVFPDVTFLDTGSMFDGYCDVRSRGSNKSSRWPAIRDKNIRETLA